MVMVWVDQLPSVLLTVRNTSVGKRPFHCSPWAEADPRRFRCVRPSAPGRACRLLDHARGPQLVVAVGGLVPDLVWHRVRPAESGGGLGDG
jgi:hypothetical protein